MNKVILYKTGNVVIEAESNVKVLVDNSIKDKVEISFIRLSPKEIVDERAAMFTFVPLTMPNDMGSYSYSNKIPAIKAIRQYTGWGLGDAKTFVENSLNSPQKVIFLSESAKNQCKHELEKIGCKLEF